MNTPVLTLIEAGLINTILLLTPFAFAIMILFVVVLDAFTQ